MNTLVDEVKAELSEAKLEPKCPECGSRLLIVAHVHSYLVNLDDETSEEIEDSDMLLDIGCASCEWCLSVPKEGA